MTDRKPLYEGRPWVKWYKTKNWHRLRALQLRREPFCRMHRPDLIAANTVDHIQPHRGDMKLFFDPVNLQSLCASCHSSVKQRMEKSGDYGCDESGIVPAWRDSHAA